VKCDAHARSLARSLALGPSTRRDHLVGLNKAEGRKYSLVVAVFQMIASRGDFWTCTGNASLADQLGPSVCHAVVLRRR